MSSDAALSGKGPGVLTGFVVVGSATVFLLGLAALLQALVGATPLPGALRNGAVIAHVASVMLALPIGVIQLVRPKGTNSHRVLGYIWIALMVFTALVSFAVHTLNPHGLSLIHLFSVLTLVSAPQIVYFARTGRIARHRRTVLGLMFGGLVIAGLFTFIPGRALGQLLGGLLASLGLGGR